MNTIREGGARAENLNRLCERGRADLFWKIIYTILMMEDREISQKQIAKHLGKDRTWVRWTLGASPKLSIGRLEQNLDVIDTAITGITDEKGGIDHVFMREEGV